MSNLILRSISHGLAIFWVLQHELRRSEAFPFGLVLLLGLISLSHLRSNHLINRKALFWLTIVAESFLCGFLFLNYGGFISVYLLGVILDLTTVKKGWALLLPLVAAGGMIPLLYQWTGSILEMEGRLIIADGMLFFLPAVFGMVLHREQNRKNLAQQLYDQLRISEEKLQKAYETLEQYSQTIEELTLLRERARISRELHDSAGHALSTLGIQLQAIYSLMDKDHARAKEMLSHIVEYTRQSLENVRRAVKELRPIEFDRFEGIFAIEELVRSFQKLSGVNVRLILSRDRYPMNSDQSHQLYRIVQECLSNSLRHGKATRIQISVQFLEDAIYSQIKDDGVGVDQVVYGMGLKGIQERVGSLNGTMAVFSEPGKGFELTITLPRRIAQGSRKEVES